MSQNKDSTSSPPQAESLASGRKKRMLPQIPVQSKMPPSTPVARGNETTINLTNVSELSTVSILNQSGGELDGARPRTREFVSPVKFSTDGEDSCVTVAVRVRPFSRRELDLQQPKPIIRMHSNEAIIKSQDNVVHRFYYDHCFWSLPENSSDESWSGRRDLTPGFADQEYVYKELAQPLLDRSFEGYNTCLFAYGQTGSGKSYCIMGEGEAIGIVPRFAQELFDRVEGTADEETSFKVQVSYYEIFKERIYDLLASTQNGVKKKLRVREHPVLGPYVEDLSTFVADSYPDIERWIHLGNRYRATAATGMNERSSRSHSVFTITLTQTMVFEGEDQSKVSRINLIDLAGSERSSVSKTSGERLKEGASINKSLHSLGKVISLLSEKGSGKRKKVFIPYRDSTLTWLLKESLGGNSKTAMIATVSPSHLHYAESLSTLRYAQQARTIVNVAKINEDPNGAIIRDLRQQITELKSLLQSSSVALFSDDPSEVKSLKEKLLESEKLMAETTRSWQEKLRESEARKQEEMERLKRSGALTVNNRQPNLVNLTEDPQLSEIVVYFLKDGVTRVGRRGEAGSHDIELSGALVMADHCSIDNETGKVTLHPSSNVEAKTYLNGELMTSSTQLHHGDRIVLGGEYFFRFNHPLEVEQGMHLKKGHGTFEYAKNELIRVQTARLEAEMEERRLKEREAMMAELQLMKDAAQNDMDHQKEEYEEKMRRLAKELVEQSMEVSHHQRSRDEAQARMEELLQRNRALEEETMTQKHLIHLEKLKAEREYEGIREEKTRLMSDLEQEKNKLVSDIEQLNKNKVLRTSVSHRDSTISLPNEPSMRGSEMVRLAMMLQEASAISKSFNRHLTFSREELTDDSGSLEVQVRVSNTQEGLVTFWGLDKFESRLELMRDLYNSSSMSGISESSTSLENFTEESDPFSDPTDSWVRESLLTPHPSPMRSSSVRSLLMSSSSTHSTSTLPTLTGTLPPRSLLDMLNSSLVSSRGGSPIAPPRTDSAPLLSLPTLCHQQISSLLHVGMGVAPPPKSMFQAVLTRALAIRDATDAIEEAFGTHSSQGVGSVSFSSTPAVCQSVLSLYTSLELLLANAQGLHHEMLVWQGLLARLLPDYINRGLVKERAVELLETISQQCALYCSRLLQGIDKETEDGIRDTCVSLRESLDLLTQQTGSLSLARQVMSKALHSRAVSAMSTSTDDSVDWTEEEDFLTLQPYQKSAVLFYRGYSDWCTLTFEHAHQQVKECLDSISEQVTTSENELVSGVLNEVSAVEIFLQRLTEMQADIWNISSPSDGTLPLTPPLPSTVDLLAHLQQVEKSVNSITAHTQSLDSGSSLDNLSSSNKQVAYCCNELAALALRVVNGSPNPQSLEYVSEVQQLSHAIARTGKIVNHIIKRGRGKERVKKKTSEEKKPLNETVDQVEALPIVSAVASAVPNEAFVEEISNSAALNESRTSMATGQLTQSPEHVAVNGHNSIVIKNHVTSKEEHVTAVPDNLVDDDDDSTLI